MSATETGTADALDPGHRQATAVAAAQQDPTVSPAGTHEQPEVTTPVPRVIVSRPVARSTERVPERGSGVKLASISRTGDRVFGALAGGSGVVIVGLVVFVGVFLLALALPSLLRDQDNFLTSRNWVVVGNELRFGIAGLLWTTALSSVIAMVLAVPVAIGVALPRSSSASGD
jgi:phosphate transport system permease protein